TVEEAVLQGGFGSSVIEFLSDHQYPSTVVSRMGIPDHFIEHGSVEELLEEIHLTSDELVERIEDVIKEKRQTGTHVL
ncbi:MAG: transketolase C-terminal domain-containing protein, partial [Paenisporosarcina sp.]